ncbi:hypothetical protein QMK17_18080 [Rhodococcus sp. G-MC3]|uniref:hypothetical protein n=1 Tax=Rhodococcus sp. G-MC3 TaxID=3046209 RepID=UPI0024B8A90A|nr:hypothetical protein [Rhodococcus sp. G-MC3]MDJ0395238.1 hypothetical protein [Rhodococcus sp. G-MC3]
MSDWAKKIKDEAKGLIAEAEQELTVLEGGDTVDLTAKASDDVEESTDDSSDRGN